jgi:hypothetical protein
MTACGGRSAVPQGVADAAEYRNNGDGTNPGFRVGSCAGPGATSSGPSAGGIGSSVLRTAIRSASPGFVFAVGVMVVVSQAARNAQTSTLKRSLMFEKEDYMISEKMRLVLVAAFDWQLIPLPELSLSR